VLLLAAVRAAVLHRQVTLSSSVAHENMVQLLDVFAEGTELIIVVSHMATNNMCENAVNSQ
jgi:hypothetical protein